jgi:hypothetical protein
MYGLGPGVDMYDKGDRRIPLDSGIVAIDGRLLRGEDSLCSSAGELDMESDGFIRTEGTEFDGVVAAVEASDSNSRDEVDDEEDGGVPENAPGRDTVEAAASSHDDCMLSDAC